MAGEKLIDLLPNVGNLPIGEALHDLRVMLDLSPEEVAQQRSTTPEEVLALEASQDMAMSTLQGQVEALGGSLRTEIVLNGKRILLGEFSSEGVRP